MKKDSLILLLLLLLLPALYLNSIKFYDEIQFLELNLICSVSLKLTFRFRFSPLGNSFNSSKLFVRRFQDPNEIFTRFFWLNFLGKFFSSNLFQWKFLWLGRRINSQLIHLQYGFNKWTILITFLQWKSSTETSW